MNQQLHGSTTRMLVAALAAMAATAQAHPGHSLFEHGGTHAITSPFHLLILAATGVTVIGAAQLIRSPRWRNATRAIGAACLAAAMAMLLGVR
jgi:hypothetical protein